jgi:WD40 repeat protein
VAFHPDGRRLATATASDVRVWDFQSGQEVLAVLNPVPWARSIAFSRDGSRLAVAGCEGRATALVKLFDLRSGRDALTLTSPSREGIRSVCFSPDGSRLLLVGGDAVALWEGTTRREELTLRGFPGAVRGLAFHPDGRRLASVVDGGLDTVWDLTTARESFRIPTFAGQAHLAFSPDGEHVVVWEGAPLTPDGEVGTTPPRVLLCDAKTGQHLQSLSVRVAPSATPAGVAFSPDGQRFAAACLAPLTPPVDRTIRLEIKVWERTGAEVLSLAGPPTDPCWNAGVLLALSPHGRRLAAGNGRVVRLWDATTGEETAVLRGPTADVTGVAFHPGGRLLAASALDGRTRVWDVVAGAEVCSLPGQGAARALAFSPDGRRLAVASGIEAVLWDVATWKEVGRLRGSAGLVYAVTFSPDSCRRALGHSDGTVRVWNVAAVKR